MSREVTSESAEGEAALVLRVSGELTGESAPLALRPVDDVAAGSAPSSVLVLDLRAVVLLSASGLRLLLAAVERCAARGIRCAAVLDPRSAVTRVLESAGTQAALPRFANVEQAVAGVTAMARGLAAQDDVLDFDRLAGQFESLTLGLLGATTVGAALQKVVDTGRVVIPAADLVSVTLRNPDGVVFTPVQTDDLAVALDRVQYASGRGPCLDAARPASPAYAISQDLAADQRWPEFTAAATRHGFRSIIATELYPGARSSDPSGALNIYSREDHGIRDHDRHTALLLATHASLALASARATELADLHEVELHRAIDSRDAIGQAKGILMNRQGITADEAFDLLSRTSQHLNVKLVDLARTLAARHGEIDEP
jgi:anti-anti-sigma factor